MWFMTYLANRDYKTTNNVVCYARVCDYFMYFKRQKNTIKNVHIIYWKVTKKN